MTVGGFEVGGLYIPKGQRPPCRGDKEGQGELMEPQEAQGADTL